MSEYRIEFSIQRRDEGDEDFVEVGFGSSGARSDVDQAAFEVNSAIQNGDWETSGAAPEPNRSGS